MASAVQSFGRLSLGVKCKGVSMAGRCSTNCHSMRLSKSSVDGGVGEEGGGRKEEDDRTRQSRSKKKKENGVIVILSKVEAS